MSGGLNLGTARPLPAAAIRPVCALSQIDCNTIIHAGPAPRLCARFTATTPQGCPASRPMLPPPRIEFPLRSVFVGENHLPRRVWQCDQSLRAQLGERGAGYSTSTRLRTSPQRGSAQDLSTPRLSLSRARFGALRYGAAIVNGPGADSIARNGNAGSFS